MSDARPANPIKCLGNNFHKIVLTKLVDLQIEKADPDLSLYAGAQPLVQLKAGNVDN
jgi:hypothetical protein